MTDYLRKSYKRRRAMLSRAIARHGWRCIICGLPITGEDRRTAQLEHKVPRSLGGDDSDENTGPSHRSCNASRGNRPLTVAIHDGADYFAPPEV